MKFLISYKVKNNGSGETFLGEFTLESEVELLQEDKVVMESALKDSAKFQRSGIGSILIKSINPCKGEI